jgi:hypothetical protein
MFVLFNWKVLVETDLHVDSLMECSCAMIEVLYDYKLSSRRDTPEWGRQVGMQGSKMVYLPAPNDWHQRSSAPKPVIYVVPVTAILGRLALVPAGSDHGTIPASMREYQARAFDMGAADRLGQQGSGSRLFYINSWAMQWASDHPVSRLGLADRDVVNE